jgi:hypothetical protein
MWESIVKVNSTLYKGSMSSTENKPSSLLLSEDRQKEEILGESLVGAVLVSST